jgi:DNA-binding winged helix-turn-helix (wHTH) protein
MRAGRRQDQLSIALVIPDVALDLEAVAPGLRRFCIHPIVLSRTENLADWLVRWKPSVAVVGGGVPELKGLLGGLERQGVAVVVVGDPDQLREAASLSTIEAGLPVPATSEEIGRAVAIAAGRLDPEGQATAEVGPLRLDLIRRAATIDGRPVQLPPREFSILAELALHPNEPIPAIELARRAWPEQPSATQEDVRQCVYRLRRFIGDDDREPALIRNRRGFGYFLHGAES